MSGQRLAVLHIHLRKCGGTSVARMFEANGATESRIDIRPASGLVYFFSKAKARYSYNRKSDFLFATGAHQMGKSLERKLSNDGYVVHTFCVLRDPIQSMISWCNYSENRHIRYENSRIPFLLSVRSKVANPFLFFLLTEWLEIPWWRGVLLGRKKRLQLVTNELKRLNSVYSLAEIDTILRRDMSGIGLKMPLVHENRSTDIRGSNHYDLKRITDYEHTIVRDRTMVDKLLFDAILEKNYDIEDITLNKDHFLSSQLKKLYYYPAVRLSRYIARHGIFAKS